MKQLELNLLYVKEKNMHQFACNKATEIKTKRVNNVISRAIEHARQLRHSKTLKATF